MVTAWPGPGCYNLQAAGFIENGRAILIPGTNGAGE